MKLRIISSALLFMVVSLHATISSSDESCFGVGSKYLSGGLSISKFGAYTAIDIGIHDLLSIGGAAGYNRYEELTGWKYRRYPILGRVALHPLNFSFLADLLLIREQVDIYGGVAAGYTLVHASWNGVTARIGTPDESGLRIGTYLGLRVAFGPLWHLFAENCGDATNFAIGIGRWF